MSFLLIFFSFVFLGLGFAFFYKPALIVQFNKFMRERVLSDTRILLERRKKGFFFFLMFFILFYLGYSNLQNHPTILSTQIISTDRLLYLSQHHLHDKEYKESQRLCEAALARDPNNAQALYQLAASQFLQGDYTAAQKSWGKAKSINPNSKMADFLRKMVVRHKNLPSENIAALP